MTKAYGFDDTNDFLLSLKTDIKLSEKTRDIYFYLPFKMLSIYPTVKIFSNISNLNRLDLVNNKFEYIPNEMSKLSNLKILKSN